MDVVSTPPPEPRNSQSVLGKAKGLLRRASELSYRTAGVPVAFTPLAKLLASERDITEQQLDIALDELFGALYVHPLTNQMQKATQFLRERNYLPNEASTEELIRYVVGQSVARSPVPVPEAVVNEFWSFFQELLAAPELKGLAELNLDIVRFVLKVYQPLLVELINTLKHTRRFNQDQLNIVVRKAMVMQGDMAIIRRQIKALRYIKPFFQADPKDFQAQAVIVADMVREFGPFFVKMAQAAAANSEFLPEEIAKELEVFHEDVPPMTGQEVEEAFSECLGAAPNDIYFGFDVDKPLRSGSIGSVYLVKKPVMVDGHEELVPVIVKVGRHNLDREFQMGKLVLGLAIISTQLWAPHSRLTPFLEAMSGQVDEFVKGFQQELNFKEEAVNQNRFARRAKQSTVWHVPKVYMASHRILEMEFLDDARSVHAMLHDDDKNSAFKREVARRLIYTMIVHLVFYEEFHGDLHPGNVMVNDTGDLYLIDWGNTVGLQGKWQQVWDYLAAVLVADAEKLADALIAVSTDVAANTQRRADIIAGLQETLDKKGIQQLTRDNAKELFTEGVDGLYLRLQTILHLLSNTQQLGVVVQGEYMHLARSVVAAVGTYASLYSGRSKWLMAVDLLSGVGRFPLSLAEDRSRWYWQQAWNRWLVNLPWSPTLRNKLGPAQPSRAQRVMADQPLENH